MVEKVNWINDYFASRVLLNFSEKEFWQATPRQIHTLLSALYAHKGLLREKSDPRSALSELSNFLGL